MPPRTTARNAQGTEGQISRFMIVGGPEARCAEGLVVVVSGPSIDRFGAASSRAKTRGVNSQSEHEIVSVASLRVSSNHSPTLRTPHYPHCGHEPDLSHNIAPAFPGYTW